MCNFIGKIINTVLQDYRQNIIPDFVSFSHVKKVDKQCLYPLPGLQDDDILIISFYLPLQVILTS